MTKSKYHKEIKPDVIVDVYDVLNAFDVTCPAVAHAVKKLLMPGGRGVKSAWQDLDEARKSIVRAMELSEQNGLAAERKVGSTLSKLMLPAGYAECRPCKGTGEIDGGNVGVDDCLHCGGLGYVRTNPNAADVPVAKHILPRKIGDMSVLLKLRDEHRSSSQLQQKFVSMLTYDEKIKFIRRNVANEVVSDVLHDLGLRKLSEKELVDIVFELWR